MPETRCPICQQPFDPSHSVALPFCSRRCREIDLGRWLDERYGLPYERPEEESPEEPEPLDPREDDAE